MTRTFPFPLEPGTHVVAKVKKLDLSGDVEIVGTVVRSMRPATAAQSRLRRNGSGMTYAVKVQDGSMIEVLPSRTTPIDTSTPEGLHVWLNALEGPAVSTAELPQVTPEGIGGDLARQLLLPTWAQSADPTSTPDITWASTSSGPQTITHMALWTDGGKITDV